MSDNNEEYYDVIDLFHFLWRARIYLLTGAFLGATIAWSIGDWRKPPLYVTQIPVTLEIAASPNSDGVITKYNQFIVKPNIADEIYSLLEADNDPSFKENFKKLNWDRRAFIALQSGQQGNYRIPLSLVSGKQQDSFEARVGLPISDPTGSVNAAIVRAAAKVFTIYNRDVIQVETISTTAKMALDLERTYAEVSRMKMLELNSVLIELYALEAKLLGRSGTPTSISISRSTDSDQVLRLLGSLRNSGKIGIEEAHHIAEQRTSFLMKIDAIKAKYDKPLREAALMLDQISSDILRQAGGNTSLAPVLRVSDAELQAQRKLGSLESYQSKRTAIATIGTTLGILFGLLMYGLRLFYLQNQVRIDAIFKDKRITP